MLPFFLHEVAKALHHKYIRKYKRGGRWVYVYAEGDRHGKHAIGGHHLDVHAHHLHEGASFSAGSGKGHFKVHSHKDGQVTFQHDDIDGKGTKGKVKTVSAEEFRKHVSGQHQDAAKSHARQGLKKRESILEKAKIHGTEKHVLRAEQEIERWKELHKDRLSDGKGTTQSDHGIFSKDDTGEDKLKKYMDATYQVRFETDHGKAMEQYNAVVAAQKDFKATHGMELSIPPKPESATELKAREEAQEVAKQEREKKKEQEDAAKQKRMEQIAKSPDGWKDHLRDKGIDPDHPYLKEHGEKAQHVWDTWGVALQPPDRPAESKEDHEKLWATMNQDMELFMGAVNLAPLRDRVARSGLSLSLEGSIPLKEEHAKSVGFESAGGIFRGGSNKLEVVPGKKAQHTFLHEFAHAMDYQSSGGRGFLSSDKDSELKKHLDALPQAHLPDSLSKERLGYYKSDAERVARAMEHFLPALGLGESAQLERKTGHYTKAQMREHADAFAGIAKHLGFEIKPEVLANYKDRRAYTQSRLVKDVLASSSTKQSLDAKAPGHDWIRQAREHTIAGKHAQALAAVEMAKKEHGDKGPANPWVKVHKEIKGRLNISPADMKTARKEIAKT